MGPDFISLGAGALTQFHGTVQIDTDGNTNEAEFHPYMNLGLGWKLSQRFSILSDLGWVFAHERSVETISRNCYYLNLHAAIHWGSFVQFGFFTGGGIFLTSISGQGGTITLKNGNDTTDYPLPFNSSLSSNLTYNAGLFAKMGYISIEVMNSIFNLTNSIKRSSQLSITAKFNIPIGKPPQPPTIKQAPAKYEPIQQDYQTDENFF